jgi:hypothetical protein
VPSLEATTYYCGNRNEATAQRLFPSVRSALSTQRLKKPLRAVDPVRTRFQRTPAQSSGGQLSGQLPSKSIKK